MVLIWNQWCSPRGRWFASKLPWGKKILMPWPHTSSSMFRWLASASEKLLLPRLGLDLTASVLSWLIWLMGKPRKTRSDGLGVSQDKPHNLHNGSNKPITRLTKYQIPAEMISIRSLHLYSLNFKTSTCSNIIRTTSKTQLVAHLRLYAARNESLRSSQSPVVMIMNSSDRITGSGGYPTMVPLAHWCRPHYFFLIRPLKNRLLTCHCAYKDCCQRTPDCST